MRLNQNSASLRCPREGCHGTVFGEQSLAVEDRGRIAWTCLGCGREVSTSPPTTNLSGLPEWLTASDRDGARYWEPRAS